MTKLDYLKFAIQNNCFTKLDWIIRCFTITKGDNKDKYVGSAVKQEWGYSYIDNNSKLEPITNTLPNEPLFKFKDKITLDNTWCSNITGTIETTIGNLLFNCICILPAFRTNYPFPLGRVSISKIEDDIAKVLQDTPIGDRDTKGIYVEDYVKFSNSLLFLSGISKITSWAATPKNIVAPTGEEEFKKKLLEKYGDTLNDPVILAKYESELKQFDSDYLKGDPSDGTFIKGKLKETSRKKLFLSVGVEPGFDSTKLSKPILNSLNERIPTDPDSYVSMMNGVRVGSFARGSETVNGGVAAKVLLRAGNNLRVLDTDCGTTLGIHRYFNNTDIDKLVGRSIIDNSKTTYIENKNIATNYMDRDIIVRSPMYCKSEGNNICKVCAGDKLNKYPSGLTIPLTEISSVLITASLKQMHSTILAVAKMKLNEAFS